MKRIFFIAITLILLLFSISNASEFMIANSDIRVFVETEHFGHFIGDVIPCTMYVEFKNEGLFLNLRRIESIKMMGAFEVKSVEISEYEEGVIIDWELQSFWPPNNYIIFTDEITLWYSGKKYWSALDNRYIFTKLEVPKIHFYLSKLDSSGRAKPKIHFYHKEFFDTDLFSFLFFLIGISSGILGLISLRKTKWFRKKRGVVFSKLALQNGLYNIIECATFFKKILNERMKGNTEAEEIKKELDEILYKDKKISKKQFHLLVYRIDKLLGKL